MSVSCRRSMGGPALALVLIGMLVYLAAPAGAVGVRPLVIDLDLDPGQTGSFTLTLVPSGQPERVHVRLYQPVQLRTGDLTYQSADPARFPAAGWLQLDSSDLEVPANQDVNLAGRVVVPFGTQGTHTVVLMVEPDVQAGPGTIGVQVRYAVRLNIRVTGVQQPPRVEVQEFRFEATDDRPQVRAVIHNPTPLDFPVSAEVTLRDAARRLLARIPLMTEVGRRAGLLATRVYPGSTVEFSAPVAEVLAAGRYDLQLFVRYAQRAQTTLRQELVLAEPVTPPRAPGPAGVLGVEPAELVFAVAPGGLATRGVEVVNLGGQPLQVHAFGQEVRPGYGRSIWPYLQVRSQLPLRLGPGERSRLLMTVQSRRDQAQGGYYGTLVLRAWPGQADAATERAEAEWRVPLALVVGDAGPPTAAIAGVAYRGPAGPGETGTVTVAVENTGQVHVAPGGRLRLETVAGAMVGQWPLEMAGDVPWLYPGETGAMAAPVPALPTGAYRAIVRIEVGGRVLVEDARLMDAAP